MGTSLSEIYDIFMLTVTDYRLNDLFEMSETDFENYLNGFLEFAIADFDICDQDLNYDKETNSFSETLTRENKTILATLMTKYWMEKVVNDITQLNLHITDRDFKVASEAMNLREKTIRLNNIKETCSQMLIDYAYKHNNWTGWLSQSFWDGVE